MRKSLVLALVVASVVSTASFAGAQAPATGSTAPHAMKHDMDGGRRGMRGGRGGALRGLTLSDAEQAKVKAIRARQKTELTSMRESMKPMMQEARALRQKGDTAGLRALHEKNKGRHEQMQALQTRYKAEIRGALSEANQAKFDANVQSQAQRRAEWAKQRKDGRRGGKHGGNRRGAGREG